MVVVVVVVAVAGGGGGGVAGCGHAVRVRLTVSGVWIGPVFRVRPSKAGQRAG